MENMFSSINYDTFPLLRKMSINYDPKGEKGNLKYILSQPAVTISDDTYTLDSTIQQILDISLREWRDMFFGSFEDNCETFKIQDDIKIVESLVKLLGSSGNVINPFKNKLLVLHVNTFIKITSLNTMGDIFTFVIDNNCIEDTIYVIDQDICYIELKDALQSIPNIVSRAQLIKDIPLIAIDYIKSPTNITGNTQETYILKMAASWDFIHNKKAFKIKIEIL